MSGVGCLRRPHRVFTTRHSVTSSNVVAAEYIAAAIDAKATPRQVHSHLVGKLALTDAATLRRHPQLRAALDTLDTAHGWDTLKTTLPELRTAFLDLPRDDAADNVSDDERGTPLADDDGDGWTKVWRDKRF